MRRVPNPSKNQSIISPAMMRLCPNVSRKGFLKRSPTPT